MRSRTAQQWRPAVPHIPRAIHVLFLILVAVVASAQQSGGAQSPSDILSSSSYADEDQHRVLEVFEQASDNEVPVELLVPRLQEGLAKRVDSGQMVQSLDRELESLRRARDVMDTVDGGDSVYRDAGSWARAANLLDSGQPPELLRSLVGFSASRPEATRPEVFRQATLLYLSVVEWGVDPELSLLLTQNVVRSTINADEFPAIAELYAVGQRSRLSPEEVGDRLNQALADGLTIRQIRRLFRR